MYLYYFVHLENFVFWNHAQELFRCVRNLKPRLSLTDAYQMELKLYISSLSLRAEGHPVLITGINHFDKTYLYKKNVNVI